MRSLGTPCALDWQKPELLISGLPQIGSRIKATYRGPNSTSDPLQRMYWPQLVAGLSSQKTDLSPRLVPHLSLQPIGCEGLVAPEIIAPMALDPSSGLKFEVVVDLTVPNDRALVGRRVYMQWMTVVLQCGISGCNTEALLTSNAVELTIG